LALCAIVISLASCKKERDIENVKPSVALNDSLGAEGYACVYTIKANQAIVDGSSLNIPAGSVVCIEAGTRGPLVLKNFAGQPGRPITFVNGNGKVTIQCSSSNSYGLKLSNCKYVKLAGNGSSDEYGIHVSGSHIGVTFEGLSTNWEMSNVEISNIGFAGLMGKTDPSCDPATWRGNFTMRDVSVHDNYVHDVTGEGFYIGNSFYEGGRSLSCGNILPHSIEGLKVYRNKVVNSGCEGIQVGCATKGCEIFDNTIENFGKSPFADNQNNGLQIGEGTGGLCYNNIIKNGPGNGIICLGYGDNVVYNNLIINAGAFGIFSDSRYTPGQFFKFANNTIVNSGKDGIMVYSEKIPMNFVVNNIIAGPKNGKFISTRSSNVKLTASNNLHAATVAEVKFLNPSANDFRIGSGSPALDKGTNTASYGIVSDFGGSRRPLGTAYDIGAFEGSASPLSSNSPSGTEAEAQIVRLTLVDAVSGRDLMTIKDGATISYSALGTNKINVRADTNSGTKSVLFKFDGENIRTESGIPYTMHGDAGMGKYNPWTPAYGAHKITTIPYTKEGASGSAGPVYTVSINVTA